MVILLFLINFVICPFLRHSHFFLDGKVSWLLDLGIRVMLLRDFRPYVIWVFLDFKEPVLNYYLKAVPIVQKSRVFLRHFFVLFDVD